jgi:hypothetical protein
MKIKSDLSYLIIILEDHPEASRIKKIIYCLSKKNWENDPIILAKFTLKELLEELFKSYPNIKLLIAAMHNLVMSLNRQEVYAPIAKDILLNLAPIYNTTSELIENSIIQALIEEKEKEAQKTDKTCINLMEIIVKEKVYQEIQKLPANVAKFISIAEISTYALNRLPPLYIASEEGKYYQSQRAEALKEKVNAAVIHGVAAVLRDPLRKSTPLNLGNLDKHSSAHSLITQLESLVCNMNGCDSKMSYEQLSQKLGQTIDHYGTAIQEIETFLQLHGLLKEKLTINNLAASVRGAVRHLTRENTKKISPPHSQESHIRKKLDAQETTIMDFIDQSSDDNKDETFATSIRDWYTF